MTYKLNRLLIMLSQTFNDDTVALAQLQLESNGALSFMQDLIKSKIHLLGDENFNLLDFVQLYDNGSPVKANGYPAMVALLHFDSDNKLVDIEKQSGVLAQHYARTTAPYKHSKFDTTRVKFAYNTHFEDKYLSDFIGVVPTCNVVAQLYSDYIEKETFNSISADVISKYFKDANVTAMKQRIMYSRLRYVVRFGMYFCRDR